MINALGQCTIFQGHQSLITNQFSILIRGSFVVSVNFFTPSVTARFSCKSKVSRIAKRRAGTDRAFSSRPEDLL